ncbi:MAG TPA: phage holin, LLH family [Clostridia bacterium]
MENIQLFFSILGSGVGFLLTTIMFLFKFIKSLKSKKAAEEIIKITNAIIPFIEQAEKFSSYSGKEKKEYVMTKVNQFAIENGIKFDPELTSQKIEELIKLSKEVNYKGALKEQPTPKDSGLNSNQNITSVYLR